MGRITTKIAKITKGAEREDRGSLSVSFEIFVVEQCRHHDWKRLEARPGEAELEDSSRSPHPLPGGSSEIARRARRRGILVGALSSRMRSAAFLGGSIGDQASPEAT